MTGPAFDRAAPGTAPRPAGATPSGPAPLVSVVIDNYNYARFLAEAVNSAQAQTWPRLEVVVVDDGSTDDSRAILATFGDRIRTVFKTNGGQGSAFNAGFAASRGDIVCFVDADDTLHPEAMARAVERFTDRSAKVHWRLEVIDADGKPLGRLFPDRTMLEGDLRERAIAEGPLYDSHELPPTTGNAWSRRFLMQVLPMPHLEWDHGADVYLHALAPLYGELQAIDAVLGSYRAHGGNHYWQSPLAPHKVEEYLSRFRAASNALAYHLKRRDGMEVDPARWRETSFNWLWLDRLRRARHDIVCTVPPGAPVVLIDDAELAWPGALAQHPLLPFPERDGLFAGRPSDDGGAVAEARRQVAAGVRFFAIWWTARWWLEAYPGLGKFFERHGIRRIESDHLLLYQITDDTVDEEKR